MKGIKMIKIIEAIKDYATDVYWDFITNREINVKDPNYFGETSDKIAEELFDFFYELIAGEKCTRCDFTTEDELKAYEDKILENVLNPDYRIVSLFNTVKVFSALSEITAQPISVLFDTPCGFENSNGTFQIGLNSFANDVTTDYGSSDTINLIMISKDNKTISMFAVDSSLIENKIKNLFDKYIGDKNIKKLYKELRKSWYDREKQNERQRHF